MCVSVCVCVCVCVSVLTAVYNFALKKLQIHNSCSTHFGG